ncbi:protein D3-like [Episyrphus balteatus]|uniref:protein D3-like n=1 Tax=Episyrphus balteatus TaxID=286459 RepID=UPI0024866470|nr:protein D3-like [Episyrphus balteatus]
MNKIVLSVLLFSAVFCNARPDDPEVTKRMKEDDIIPDVISEDVPDLLEITFATGITANLGNEITPTEAQFEPKFNWKADPNKYYFLVTLDPDAPGPDDPFNALLNTHMVGNIPGKDVSSGDVIFEYLPPATPKGVGFNRYASLIFEQPEKLDFDIEHIDDRHFEGRQNFDLEKVVSDYNLGEPLFGNFYKSQYDDSVLLTYKKLNCCIEYNKP